jgi:hypothetical protein
MMSMAMLTEHYGSSNVDHAEGLCNGTPSETGIAGARAKKRAGSETPLSSELVDLAAMNYSDLHLAWRRHCRSVPPKKISRDILELGIAWKIQENRLGGLGTAVKRQLAELAKTMATKSDLAKQRAVALKPGARVLRSWEGVTHEVLVVEDGFLWAGKTWASLSAIAREITGTRWSGPRFFGLNARVDPDTSAPQSKVSDHE